MSENFEKDKPENKSQPGQPEKPVLGRYEDFEDDEPSDETDSGAEKTGASLDWDDDDLDDEDDDYGMADLTDTDTYALLTAQRALVVDMAAGLAADADAHPTDVVRRWRAEAAEAALRFLDASLRQD